MANITTLDNLFNQRCFRTKGTNGIFADGDKNKQHRFFSNSASNIEQVNLTLGDYQQLPSSQFFPLDDSKNKQSPDDLVISIQKQGDNYLVNTGNYIGSFEYAQHQITIESRFGRLLLERMLGFTNNMYLSFSVGDEKQLNNPAQFVLYFVFIQELVKAFLMGFPKVYQTQRQHDANIRGNVDIAHLIQRDIPFKGKISSQYREQRHDLNIASVLLAALQIVLKSLPGLDQDALKILHGLKQLNPPSPSPEVFMRAFRSKALTNPLFSPYKRVLKLAKLIIENGKLGSKGGKQANLGFIVNVAELFEHYVRSLLKQHFPKWKVHSPKIKLYSGHFYERHIIPDIVMEQGDKVVVFDSKYKTMEFHGRGEKGAGDLDRQDFFQIHTYMSYYQNQSGKQLIGGGLLYPLNGTNENTTSNGIFSEGTTWFCVDGVDFSNAKSIIEIKLKEKEFLSRMDALITT